MYVVYVYVCVYAIHTEAQAQEIILKEIHTELCPPTIVQPTHKQMQLAAFLGAIVYIVTNRF